MRKIEQYSVQEGVTPLSGPELSERFLDIDGRLHLLEELKVSWEQAVLEVQNHGLERINGVIEPLLDQARDLVDLVQDQLDGITVQWQDILDGWASVQGTLDGMSTDISDLQTEVTDTKSDLADTKSDVTSLQTSVNEILASSEPIRFAQMGAISIMTDIVKIPAGVPLTLSKISVIVGTAPAGGPCSIALKKNGTSNIFTSGTLSIANGAKSASTTSLQNNQLVATDFIRVDVTAANSAQDLMIVIEF